MLQTGQDRQTDSIGRTVLQTVAQKQIHWQLLYFLAVEFFDDYAQERMLHDDTGTDNDATVENAKNSAAKKTAVAYHLPTHLFSLM